MLPASQVDGSGKAVYDAQLPSCQVDNILELLNFTDPSHLHLPVLFAHPSFS
jgi:hypothetical protein